MNELLSALSMISDPAVILALLVGSIGGVIVGAIPGVGPPVAIAIILPAIFVYQQRALLKLEFETKTQGSWRLNSGVVAPFCTRPPVFQTFLSSLCLSSR